MSGPVPSPPPGPSSPRGALLALVAVVALAGCGSDAAPPTPPLEADAELRDLGRSLAAASRDVRHGGADTLFPRVLPPEDLPLLVVDGVPTNSGGLDRLGTLRPEDIEEIRIVWPSEAHEAQVGPDDRPRIEIRTAEPGEGPASGHRRQGPRS